MYNTIKLGSQGEQVVKLQNWLNIFFKDARRPISVDGKYGVETKNAVKHFQYILELNPDGVCGPMTWAALQTEMQTDIDEETFNEESDWNPVEATFDEYKDSDVDTNSIENISKNKMLEILWNWYMQVGNKKV